MSTPKRPFWPVAIFWTVSKLWHHSHNNRNWPKTSLKVIFTEQFITKTTIFAVFMYFLYCHPRYFKFKQNCYGSCFETSFSFLITMFIVLCNTQYSINLYVFLDLCSSSSYELSKFSLWKICKPFLYLSYFYFKLSNREVAY